jgi:alpha-L-arabinofuranosidase
LIFFDNVNVCLTPNYYVQKLFSVNQGDSYFDHVITKDVKDTTLAVSCVQSSESGDIILKMVNAGTVAKTLQVDLGVFNKPASIATKTILTGSADAENTFEDLQHIFPVITTIKVGKSFEYVAPAMSLTVIRIQTIK